MRGGEYYVLCLTALLGIFVLISANSLLTVYLGIELLSLSLYAMVAFDRDSGIAAEAAIKYFVLGAIASGVLLYGMSMLYGLTGTLDLDQLSNIVRRGPDAGADHRRGVRRGRHRFQVRRRTVPHVGAGRLRGRPDQRDAVHRHGLDSRLVRADPAAARAWAGRYARDLDADADGGGGAVAADRQPVVAIAQTNLKRMLAYSAIANAGFVLLGFATGNSAGYQAALNFTVAYVITTLATFGMILMLSRRGFEHDEIADFKGLATRDPLLAAMMLVLMFSTAGVPPFIGFWAKLWIIQALLGGNHVWLATFAVLISVVGAFYYLRVVWYMYFEAAGDRPVPEARPRMRFILLLNTAAVTIMGLLPNALLRVCERVIP